jgi:alkylation response protein AidB-like acyl-CoA dehydrogenase
MNERVYIGGNAPPRGSGMISAAVDLYQKASNPSAATRDELMQLWTRAEVLRLTNLRAGQNRRKGGNPGPEGSIGKLGNAELNQHISSFCVDLMGPDGLLYDTYDLDRDRMSSARYGDVRVSFLRSRANTIEGGTSEVMRNILGERVLGLPGDVRTDKDVSWSEVPRN